MKKLLFLLLAVALLFGCAKGAEDMKSEKPSPSVSERESLSLAEPSDEDLAKPEAPDASFRDKSTSKRAGRGGDVEALEERSSALAPAPAPRADTSPRVPSQSGLKAGFADDNKAYNAYLEFLEKYKDVEQIKFPVAERIVLRVADKDGAALPDASLTFLNGAKELGKAQTLSNGETLFFPLEYPSDSYTVKARYKGVESSFTLKRAGEREETLTLNVKREIPKTLPVDILFILDTTGSMGEEIERLKNTLLIVRNNLTLVDAAVNIRFGMVAYKDRGDAYVTRVIPFTEDAKAFQQEIAKLHAGGGGDTPEDMQKALEVAVKDMAWRSEGVRVAYLITDANAHLDYGETFTLLSSATLAREKGIRLHSVGTGGLPIEGEINLRQVAQYTGGKYIFLTYGERGDSSGGEPGSVSHHVGGNFTADKLETVIIRFTKDDISEYLGKPLDKDDDYFEAEAGKDSAKILQELFSGMTASLVNYSGFKVTKNTPTAVLPLASDPAIKAAAEYFTEQLYYSATNFKGFKHVERKDLQKILTEMKFNLSGLIEDENALKAGKLIGAELLITGTVYKKEKGYEVYLHLLRTETGEVLAVSTAKIDAKLY